MSARSLALLLLFDAAALRGAMGLETTVASLAPGAADDDPQEDESPTPGEGEGDVEGGAPEEDHDTQDEETALA